MRTSLDDLDDDQIRTQLSALTNYVMLSIDPKARVGFARELAMRFGIPFMLETPIMEQLLTRLDHEGESDHVAVKLMRVFLKYRAAMAEDMRAFMEVPE